MAKKVKFDVVVIGSGPGGYPAAIRAAQEGKSCALVEAGTLGGTCLNRGCIPTKSLLVSAAQYVRAKKLADFGVTVSNVSFDFSKMVENKNRIVSGIRSHLERLIEMNKITVFKGFGKLGGEKTVKVFGEEEVEIEAKNIILAMGSEPKEIPAFKFDHEKILSSTSLLDSNQLPIHLVLNVCI